VNGRVIFIGGLCATMACAPKVLTPAHGAARTAFVSATPPATIVVARDARGRRAFIADEYAKAISIVTLDTTATLDNDSIALDGTPSRIAVGTFVYVTLRDLAHVVAYEIAEDGGARKVGEARTSPHPSALALTRDRKTLLVTGEKDLRAFDAYTLMQLFLVPLEEEPSGVIVSGDGKRAFISHAATSTLNVVELPLRDTNARTISLDVTEQYRTLSCDPSCLMLPGERLAPSYYRTRLAMHATELATVGDELFIPETLTISDETDDSRAPGLDVSVRTHTAPHVARVKMSEESLLTTKLGDSACYNTDAKPRCTEPTAVATLGTTVYVACAGIDTIIEHREDGKYDEWPECLDARQHQRRFDAGRGIRGIAVDPGDHHAFVWSKFDRTVTEIDLDAGSAPAPMRRYRISTSPAEAAVYTAPSVRPPSKANPT